LQRGRVPPFLSRFDAIGLGYGMMLAGSFFLRSKLIYRQLFVVDGKDTPVSVFVHPKK
jgi:hypothetical protein